MKIERSNAWGTRLEHMGPEKPSQGDLNIRYLGTQPSQEVAGLYTGCKKGAWSNSATVHQSWLSVNTLVRQLCQPIRLVESREQVPMDHHSRVNWSTNHNRYTLSESVVHQHLNGKTACFSTVEVLVPRTPVVDEQQRKNCHQKQRKALPSNWPLWLYFSLHFT